MAVPTLQTRISLSRLECKKEQEVVGDDEPYLWTGFFKLDGDTAVLDLIGEGPDDQLGANDCFIRGTFTFVPSEGSHDNLGTDMASGDIVGIPAALGTAAFTLKPIPVTPRAQAKLGVDVVAGGLGFVAALMEEDRTTDVAAEKGHAAFNRALEDGINDLIYQDGGPTGPDDLKDKLGVKNRETHPTDEQIATIKAKVFSAVKKAIRDEDGIDIDHDELIASTHRFVFADDLVADAVQEIYDQLAQISNGALVADYRLAGDILGIDAGTMSYSWIQRSEEFGTPPAAGVPTTFPFPGLGVTDIVYCDTSGHLWELWRNAAGITGKRNLTLLATGATKAAGNPVAYADTDGGQVMLAYRDAGTGHIHTMYWSTGGVGHENLTGPTGAPAAAGNPIALFVPETRTQHIIYRTGDGHLHVVYWQGGDPAGHEDMTAWASAVGATGDASAYYVTSSREHIVVYRGTDGHIHDIHWRIETPFQPEDLSGVAGTPPAAGDPSAYHIAALDLHQMTYRAVDGHLYEIYCVGEQAVQGWDLTAATGVPDAVATSDPVAYYHAPTNTKHVVYREANDHLYDIQWVPNSGTAPQRIDLTLMALADRAAGKPAAFLGLGTDQHVVYRSAGNQIHEIVMSMTP